MKKKRVIIIAAALAVVLLTGTAVYAVGNLGSGSNQANKPVEQPSLSTAAVEAEKLQTPLTAEQVDISAYSVPLGTKAEQILRNTLTKKQMTEQEMQYYNSMPDEIKMLTRAEAVERLEELTQWLEENEKEISEYTDEELEQRQSVSTEQLLCKLYIECMTTGMDGLYLRASSMIEQFEYSLANTENKLTIWGQPTQGNKNRKLQLEFLLDVSYDIQEDVEYLRYDYQTALNKLNCVWDYWNLYNSADKLENINPEVFYDYAQRYQSGESIESILG